MPQNHLDWITHLSTDYFGSGSIRNIIFYDESLIFSTEILKRDFYSLAGYRVVGRTLAFNDHQIKYCQVKICLSFSQGKSHLKPKQHFTSKENRCCWGGQLRFTLWTFYVLCFHRAFACTVRTESPHLSIYFFKEGSHLQ